VKWFRWRHERNRRLEEARAALARQERLGEVIDWQRAEAAEVSAWARERLQLNHLTELFITQRSHRP
jgi:hypothetical protein